MKQRLRKRLLIVAAALGMLAAFQFSPRLLADTGDNALPAETAKVLDALVAIRKSLADDSMEHVGRHAAAIDEHGIRGLPEKASEHAAAVARAGDIKSARTAFKKLNESFEAFLNDHPDTSGKYRVAYCPMAKASWVQTGASIANPYYGRSMLKCGSFKN